MAQEKLKIEYHPACLLLPKMSDEEFEALRASIRQGYDNNKPIILYRDSDTDDDDDDGMILDGRHRYKACELEGVHPSFDLVEDIDPYEYVLREHTSRRSWKSQEQKALICGKLVEQSEALQQKIRQIHDKANKARSEATKEQHGVSNPRAGEKKEIVVIPQCEGTPKTDKNKSMSAKADMIGVSRPAVERAEMIERKSPELAQKVIDGDISATEAIKQIRSDKKTAKPEDTTAGPVAIKQASNQELIAELMSRANINVLCIYQLKAPAGKAEYHYSHNFSKDIPISKRLHDFSRMLDEKKLVECVVE